MNKLRFLSTFLLVFALLLVVWNRTGSSRWYTRGFLAVAAVMGPSMHGWVMERHPGGHRAPVWVRGDKRVRTAIQFDALSIAVLPALALLAATPGLGVRRRARLMLLAAALCFLIDSIIVALFPLLVFYKNPFTDVIGTFLGVVAFVGAPVLVWGVLTFRDLQRFLPALRRHQPRLPVRP
ncbi:MAG: hypothetical protein ACE5I7_09025 [Candidatus Binatia bacterium]